MVKTDGMSGEAEAIFEKAFGFRPSRNARLANLETRVVNQKLDVIRSRIREHESLLNRVATMIDEGQCSAPDGLRQAEDTAHLLDESQVVYNRLIALARKFGLKPVVYRSARRSR